MAGQLRPRRKLAREDLAAKLSGAPLVLEGSAALLKTAPDPADLEHRLDAAGFAGDAYDRRLRAVALARALAMAMARP